MTALTDKFEQIMQGGGGLTEILLDGTTKQSVQSSAQGWCERNYPRMKPVTRQIKDRPEAIRVGFTRKSSSTIAREEEMAHRRRLAGLE